jgi:hypothetical protein
MHSYLESILLLPISPFICTYAISFNFCPETEFIWSKERKLRNKKEIPISVLPEGQLFLGPCGMEKAISLLQTFIAEDRKLFKHYGNQTSINILISGCTKLSCSGRINSV